MCRVVWLTLGVCCPVSVITTSRPGAGLRDLIMSEDPGVSRSGRVRKKSSKLSDYQSPEAEVRPGKRPAAKSSSLTLTANKTSISSQPPDLLLDDDEAAAGVFVEAGVEMNLNFEQSLDIEVNVREEEVGEDDSDSDQELLPTAPRTEIIKKPDNLPLVKRPRRDRDRPQVTAYSLWAQETRATVLASEPGLDPALVRQRLTDLWASVPSQEKFSWKRKARSGLRSISEPQPSLRTREAEPQQTLDMAAHLTLLGESLTVIGGRLREHEGQIAVSGSLR